MKTSTASVHLAVLILLSSVTLGYAGPRPQEGPPQADSLLESAERPPHRITRTSTPIKVDGALDDPAWADALRVTLDYEWFPAENLPAPVETEVFLTYDDDNLYVGFRAGVNDEGLIIHLRKHSFWDIQPVPV